MTIAFRRGLSERRSSFRQARLLLEDLEGRTLLSGIVVNTIKDSTDAIGSSTVSLRDAITQANANKVPFSITFDPKVFATEQTIVLGSRLNINNNIAPITITGPSAGVIVSGNYAVGDFVVSPKTTATLNGLTIEAGRSAYGAGVDCLGNVTLNQDIITGDDATSGGGGVFNSGVAHLVDTTVSYDSGTTGGGIWNMGGSSLTLTNVTVCENNATSGGGIYNGGGGVSGGTTELYSTTIFENLSTTGGAGVYSLAGGTVGLVNTVIGGNGTGTPIGGESAYGPDVTGAFRSKGYNLIEATNTSTGWVSTDLTGTLANRLNPLLTVLDNNGGPTPSIMPLDGSPLINHGSDSQASSITTDQRGQPRVVGGTVDIGAVETAPLVVNTTSDNSDNGEGDSTNEDDEFAGPSAFGTLSLRQATSIADLETAATSISFDVKVFATEQTITLGSEGALTILNGRPHPITIAGPVAGVIITGTSLKGGFFVMAESTLTLTGFTITVKDSGVTNNGTLTLINDTIAGVTTTSGTGLVNSGVATLIRDTISGRKGNYDGVGISNEAKGYLSLTDTTIANNASKYDDGGGIFNAGTAVLNGCTIVGNSSGLDGAGIYNASTGTVTLVNSIVAKNVLTSTTGVGPDVFGTFVSKGYNLIGATNGSKGWLGTDLTGTLTAPLDPKLNALPNNGGPTLTMLPQSTSPALKHGSVTLATGITSDQRGYPRVISGKINIGSVEVS